MKHFVIALYDLKAASYAPPGFFPAKGVAIRAFGDAIVERQGNLGRHPEDYLLQQLGAWDDQDGTFTNETPPVTLASGAEFAAAQVINQPGANT